MNIETFPINEKKEIRRKFKKCYDVIELEDKNSKKFLKSDRLDNILIIKKFGIDNYKVNCYTRSSIEEILRPRYQPPFISKNCKDIDSNNFNIYYPLNIGDTECYFTVPEIRKFIDTNYQIYYVEPIKRNNQEFKVDCQGRINTVYTIKVCGGRTCLPTIFRGRDESGLPRITPALLRSDQEESEEEDEDEEDEDEIEIDYDNPESVFLTLIINFVDRNNLEGFNRYLDILLSTENGRRVFSDMIVDEFEDPLDIDPELGASVVPPLIFYLIDEGKHEYVKSLIQHGHPYDDDFLYEDNDGYEYNVIEYLIDSTDDRNQNDINKIGIILDAIPNAEEFIEVENLIQFAEDNDKTNIARFLEEYTSD